MSDSNDLENNADPRGAVEPSMEEILASIRRILKEEEGTRAVSEETDDDMLVLDESMMAPVHGDVPLGAELPGDAQAPQADTHNGNVYPSSAPEVVTRDFVLSQASQNGLLTNREFTDTEWPLQESNVN
ncbi:MAG TPA: hypothetical protein PLY97_08165, partial [Acidocella sp.]|nr:hypothetical protein [Acidocella sp.]